MFRVSFRTYCILAAIFGAVTILPSSVTGGTCWGRYDPERGTCLKFLRLVASQDQCCSSRGFAYTTKTMTNKALFRGLVMTPEGVPKCIPCSSITADICSDIECSAERECVAVNGQPRCTCNPDCSDVETNAPVCGSDGVNYRDECRLRMEQCETKLDIEVAYQGYCRDACEYVDCRGRRCFEDANGVPGCMNCTLGCFDNEVQGSVCGHDNITYESQCHLRLTACSRGVVIPKRHPGRCQNSIDCSTVRCLESKVCAMNEEEPHCSECHLGDCSSQPNNEICGSDNITYDNICCMKREICQSRRYISKSYHGQCVNTLVTPVNIERAFRKYVCRFGQRSGSVPYSYEERRRNADEGGGQ